MESWGHPLTIAMLAASAVLLASFVVIESRAAHPLLPLRVVRDRTRGGAYLSLGLAASAMFAVFLFLTYYLQRTQGLHADRDRAGLPPDDGRDHLDRDGGQPRRSCGASARGRC